MNSPVSCIYINYDLLIYNLLIMILFNQAPSRDSGYPDWEQEQQWHRMRSGSVSGSDAGHPHLQRKFSNISCPPGRNMPQSASVLDLNGPMAAHRTHGYPGPPMQHVRIPIIFLFYFI